MEKKHIISKEEHFMNYLKENAPFYGVIGHRGRLENGKFIKENTMFLVLDSNLKVTFESKPFTSAGEFTGAVKKELARIKALKNINVNEFMRTDDSVDEMIAGLMTNAALEWYAELMDENETEESGFPKRRDPETMDIAPSSAEYELLETAQDTLENCLKPYGNGTFATSDIQYNLFTDKGKKAVDDCMEFLKTNKSKTIVQDAFIQLLVSRNVEVDWKPYDRFAFDLVAKNIDYSTVEEINEKREKRYAEMRSKISPEMRADLKSVAERMKNNK
jgi:hypothetical protein